MNAAVAQKPYEVPNGGLASFLTATTGDWSDEALNGLDYEIIRPTADQLAEFGREGDNRIAHVADGETVIPMEVFQEDPALKEALFGRMREMGIDPERYVVGNQLNSINPVTGQPEFFLKKLFKGVKKAVKGVVKVFKKIAPIVLSVGLNFLFPGLGAIAAGALGSGIGTLVQGGNLKDAFKAALIGGAVGGISSGIGSVMKGGEFMAGVRSGLPTGMGGGVNPTIPGPKELAAKISEGVPDYVAPATPGPEIMPPQAGADNVLAATKEGMQAAGTTPPAGNYLLGPAKAPAAAGTTPPAGNYLLGPAKAPAAVGAEVPAEGLTATAGAEPSIPPGADTTASGAGSTTAGALDDLVTAASSPRTFLEKLRAGDFIDAFKGQTGVTKEQIMEALLADANETLASAAAKPELFASLNAQADLILSNLPQPGMLAKYGPMTALGLGAMGLAGGFNAQDPVAPYNPFADMILPTTNLGQPGSDYARLMGLAPGGAANGGDISSFPRRNGAIRGPGTETSDDIPAMLSDGEFVMTARAVRGAGNGSRQKGMQQMYDMMRTFEGRAPRGN